VHPGAEELERLQREIAALLASLTAAESTWADLLGGVNPEHRRSAINLVHYWALRQRDLRDLQWRLKAFGLSSLGRSEANVQATLTAPGFGRVNCLPGRDAPGAQRSGWIE
jgi:pyruvate kinase